MIGKIFGKWTVLKDSGQRCGGGIVYECKCECGNIGYVVGWHLRRGNSTQCKKCSTKILRIKNTKNFGCMICGSDKHYAKGLCRNCYSKEYTQTQKSIDYRKSYRETHREEAREYQKKYRELHK